MKMLTCSTLLQFYMKKIICGENGRESLSRRDFHSYSLHQNSLYGKSGSVQLYGSTLDRDLVGWWQRVKVWEMGDDLRTDVE